MNALTGISSVYQHERPSFVRPADSPSSQGFVSHLFTPNFRVRVNPPASQWLVELTKRFDEIVSLPKGWDGYAGVAVTFTCASFAAHLLERLYVDDVPAPQLVPGSDGSVQIEWHVSGYDIELDVLAPYEVTAMRRNVVTNEVDELDLKTDFTVLTDWIANLKAPNVRRARMRG